MKLIKLHTINSTNSFLKELSQNTALQNYTAVMAKEQTSGRGQMHQTWESEKDKNLLISIFKPFSNLNIQHQKYLNFAVSLTIFNLLERYSIPNLHIKWPNDILSGNKKICGILIETSLKKDQITSGVIGIGLNVNQKEFSKQVPNAISMINFLKKETDIETLAKTLITELKKQITLLELQKFSLLEEKYLAVLYKKGVLNLFKDQKNNLFMGIIKNISDDGKLQILLENDLLKEFGVKEISFL